MISNYSIAELIVRLILGILILAQGYDKIFKVKISGVIQTFEHPMEYKIPHWLLVISSYFTSYVELIGGLFLIVGFGKSFILPILGIDLILVAVGFSIIKPMWDMQYYFPRLVMLIFLILIPHGADVFSLDHILGNH
jgi:uncharacterized membrane protein YphA (DoxX/SURF4 family)